MTKAPPPMLAILGAGPTGLEAALAAIDHGYRFRLYEAAPAVAGHFRSWGHVRLFSPWSLDVSPRMSRHLEGANSPAEPLRSRQDDCPTGHQLVDTVFAPLAALGSLAPHLQLSSRVVEIGRKGLVKSDEIGTGKRAGQPFRLLVEGADGEERIDEADVVLDCTGTYSNPNRLGDGGIYAPGERAAGERIVRSVPDVANQPEPWAGQTTLVVGAGHSAHTAVCALAELADEHPETRILWALRNANPNWETDPHDPLPERARLVRAAADLAAGGSAACRTLLGVVVESVEPQGERLQVTLRATDGGLETVSVDRMLALTGSVGDHSIYRQLQVHECYATSGPMKLAAALLGATSSDCLAQESHGADTLTNPEPGFFVLGSKSYGRNNSFLMRVGWQQVEEVFGLLNAARSEDSLAVAAL